MPTNKNTLSLTMPKKTWILAEAKTRPSKLLLPRQQELLLMLEKQTEELFLCRNNVTVKPELLLQETRPRAEVRDMWSGFHDSASSFLGCSTD